MPAPNWALVGMPDGVKVNLVRLPDVPKPTEGRRSPIVPRGPRFNYRMRQIALKASGDRS